MSAAATRLKQLGRSVGKHSDLALVAVSIIVIALMVLPVPFVVLDIMVAANIAFAIAMLLYSIYMASPASFSTFPSVLLITTLLRIALNVATTRQILLNENAGEIIATFGRLVVGGNLVVGLVVFIIITVIQFIVIAKGAERVAEVIARFTLDAIPGKQMSIDTDLRSGLISEEVARRRRHDVEQESTFFGAMDGAMKFVKGDAIAGIITVMVNLLGGIAIGVIVKGYDIGLAAQRYSILSIGEGLASQIPALFIALSAGLIVTRSSSSNSGPLAKAMTSQILSQPRALLMTGTVVSLFALVPGFPVVTFLVLGVAIAGLGAMILIHRRSAIDGASVGMESMAREGTADLYPIIDEATPPSFAALLIEVPTASLPLLSREELDIALLRLRRDLSLSFGLPFPGIRIRVNDKLEPLSYVISVLEVNAVRGQLREGSVLAFASAERLASLQIQVPDGPPVFMGAGVHWIALTARKIARQQGIACWSVTQLLVAHLETVIELHAHRLLGVQDVQALVTACAKEYPDLVREAMKIAPLPRLTKVLKGLSAEGVSLRNMRDILQVSLEVAGTEKSDEAVIERIRIVLGRAITYRFLQGQSKLSAYLIEPSTEDLVRRSITMSGQGVVAALSPANARALLDAIKRAVLHSRQNGRHEVIPLLAAADIRRPLRKLIEAELPWMAVISHEEIGSGIDVGSVAMIRIS
ncbi:MAG: flagellar biosynthesis protein FlhA [Pseudomonadota bacterium]